MDIREEVRKIRPGGRGRPYPLWAACTSMPCETLCAVVDGAAREAEDWPRRRRTVKVKLRWYVMPSDVGPSDFLTAERVFELPWFVDAGFSVRPQTPPHGTRHLRPVE